MAKKEQRGDIQDIIENCDPVKAAQRFRSHGKCGNEGLFMFCQHLKNKCKYLGYQEFILIDQALPYIRQWYKHWKSKLVDQDGRQLTLMD